MWEGVLWDAPTRSLTKSKKDYEKPKASQRISKNLKQKEMPTRV